MAFASVDSGVLAVQVQRDQEMFAGPFNTWGFRHARTLPGLLEAGQEEFI